MSIRTILVDDDADVREVVRDVLTKESDIRVVGEAENGRLAVSLASELVPDVVVVDIDMPVMNGIDATAEIVRRQADVPVIAMSMHDRAELVRLMFEAGARGYLRKDTAAEELAQAIRTVVGGSTYLSRHILPPRAKAETPARSSQVVCATDADGRAARLLAAIEHLSEPFALWDSNDALVVCNTRYREFEQEIGERVRPGTEITDWGRPRPAGDDVPRAPGPVPGGPPPRVEVRRDGGGWALVADHPLPDGSTATVVTDITERKRAERAVVDRSRTLEAVLAALPDGVEVCDDARSLVLWNRSLFGVLGVDRGPILGAHDPGMALRLASAARGAHRLMDAAAEVAGEGDDERASGRRTCEAQLIDGRWVEYRGAPLTGGGTVGLYRDVTDSRRHRERLEYLASYDDLTGLLNRRRFMEVAVGEYNRARRYGRPLSFLVIDVDRFKSINDSFGHGVGDQALRRITEACRQGLRETDRLGRIGGEEFGAMLPETEPRGAELAAERLRERIAELVAPGLPSALRLSVSIGVAALGGDHASVSEVISDADVALYEAKQGGRNRVVCRAH